MNTTNQFLPLAKRLSRPPLRGAAKSDCRAACRRMLGGARSSIASLLILSAVCAAAATVRAAQTYQPYSFGTLAGNPSYGSADGTGSAAQFSGPTSVAVDSAGNLYVADSFNNAIRKITSAGVVTTLADQAGSTGSADGTGSAANFDRPSGVAVDSAGNVYVADTNNHTIRKITPGGVVTTVAGLAGTSGTVDGAASAARFKFPQGVAVDGAGNVYVADTNSSTIRKISFSAGGGVVTTLAGLGGSSGSVDGTGSAARFSFPEDVAVDGTGSLYVADSLNHTIRKITSGGVVTTLAGSAANSGSVDGTGSAARFHNPSGVTVDSAGNLYVADSGNSTVRKVTPSGVVTTLAGLAGSIGSADGTGNAARFGFPQGITVDSGGNLYVADADGNTIRKITPGGVVTTLAGLPGGEGSADGTGTAARFTNPSSIAVDNAGTAYVADSVNNTIRKITPAGVVTTLAGQAGSKGSADGSGSAARFSTPYGITVDSAGNLYVADSDNSTIRKITAAGDVTTLAGLAGSSGDADGTGSAARFTFPSDVAVDRAGNVYVADQGNSTIRKITPAGVVTTLAGQAGITGSDDGTGSAARFAYANGVGVDSAGNVYVADIQNSAIRKITPAGVVTTLAGLPGTPGSDDGTGSAARFNSPADVAVDSAGNVYVTDSFNNTIRKVTPAGVVTTLAGLPGVSGRADGIGSDARFYNPAGIAVDIAGILYVADASNNTIRKGVSAAAQPLNIATRMQVSTGDNVLIAGFIVTGPANSTKKVMIRGIGPSLAQRNIPNVLSDPFLELRGPNNLLLTNDSWQQAPNASEIPNGFQPSDSREAVIIATLTVGSDGLSSFTAVVRGANGETGVGLVEAYDLSPASNQLANISTRGIVGQGDNVMIAGFILGGTQFGSEVLIRALGPSVPVNGALADPTLEIHDKDGVKIATNDNWRTVDGTGESQEAAIAATQIPPPKDLESAVLADFAPGAYTAILSGKNGGTGIGLVEVYNLK